MSFVFANVIFLYLLNAPWCHSSLSSCFPQEEAGWVFRKLCAQGQACKDCGSSWSCYTSQYLEQKLLNPELDWYDGEQDTTSFLHMFTGSVPTRKKTELWILFHHQFHLIQFRTNSFIIFSHCRKVRRSLYKSPISAGVADCCGPWGSTLRCKIVGNISLTALPILPRPAEHNHLGHQVC